MIFYPFINVTENSNWCNTLTATFSVCYFYTHKGHEGERRSADRKAFVVLLFSGGTGGADMHMSDAFLSPAVGAAFWAGSLGTLAHSSRKLREHADEKLIPLMGVMGAFIFAAQMINFTIPATGSSGHIGGGMILAILLGPYAGFITIASVLFIQSLFFADGGILALGCNIWNLGIFPCFIAYPYLFKKFVQYNRGGKRITIASIISVIASLQMGAFSVVVQTSLSGRTDLPFLSFSAMMLAIHLVIGLIEGFVTAGVVNYVKTARPEILEDAFASEPVSDVVSVKRLVVVFALIAFITGGALSWFASKHPDGLEWSVAKVLGDRELLPPEHGIIPALKKIQRQTAVMPDYEFRAENESENNPRDKPWPAVSAGTSLSGLLGSLMVIGLILLVGLGIKSVRRARAGS